MRWFFCSLATVVILCGCSVPTTQAPRPRVHNEAATVELVKELEGEIQRDDKQPGKPVVEVVLQSREVRDADVSELKHK